MKRLISILAALALSASLLFAASAQELYNDFSSAVESGNLSGAVSTYEELDGRLKDELATAEKSMEKALKNNNRSLYLEARDEFKALSAYRITKEQTDALLSLIVEEGPEKALEYALWLYDNSSYYRPKLTLDYSEKGENFSFSYRSSMSVRPGSEITLPDQSAVFANANMLGQLVGWGITSTESTYSAGEVITMPITDQTLYAIWKSAVTFTDDYTGLSNVTEDVSEGDEIEIPSVTAPENMVFIGWHDRTTGEFIGPEEEIYTVRGNGATFEALYASVEISNLRTRPYTTLPQNTQVTLTFNVQNTGNEDLKKLEVNISSEDEDFHILGNTLYFRRLAAGSTGTVSTRVVYTGTQSSKEIPLSITITDSTGAVWESDFTLTSK